MTNEQIIADAAVSAGLYTSEEIKEFIDDGKDIPLHTVSGWSARGEYRIKPGEHGIETRLWKKRKDEGFYLSKAYLFSENQVELLKEG